MKRARNIAIVLIGLTAIIGVGLWMAGFPPPSDDPAKQGSVVRAVVTWPLFWAGMAAAITAIIIRLKSRNFSGAKSDALPTTGVLAPAVIGLMMQILIPLTAYDVISKTSGKGVVLAALTLFFVVVGNYIVTVQPDSRLGIRNRWTQADPAVWAKVHRFFGVRLIITALIVAPLAFMLVPRIAHFVLVGAVVLLKGVTYLHARRLALRSAHYRQESPAS